LLRVLYNFARSDPALLEGGYRLGMDEHDSLQLGTPKVDLASYIDEFSSFYLKKASEKPEHLG